MKAFVAILAVLAALAVWLQQRDRTFDCAALKSAALDAIWGQAVMKLKTPPGAEIDAAATTVLRVTGKACRWRVNGAGTATGGAMRRIGFEFSGVVRFDAASIYTVEAFAMSDALGAKREGEGR